ncbi:hypothetical protein M7I_0162 [Glarea lozoyensis 74030]|uniref:Something about silencing protein 4 domain-containing protein n=1 Tax=Glarea lozoyensis (strain ATCC 74030 / MF5533) TaxID=1104152 RepID=H0ECM0_GLAL7|nr:hypothetical protein M7I_0162 [Glarea lozoyensis 74030]
MSTVPMASIHTRSSRKSDSFTTRSSTRSNVAPPPSSNNDAHNRLRQSNIGRRKRSREDDSEDEDTIKNKKAKITVQFKPRSQAQSKTRSLVIKDSATSDVLCTPASPPPETQEDATPLTKPPPPLRDPPIHHQKVSNGLKHELDRLQPNAADLKDDKRKLRSTEGTRFKSELSAYFPEYDEVIGNEPKDDYILTIDTPIIIIDSATKNAPKHPSPRKAQLKEEPLRVKEFPSSLFDDVNDAQRVDYSFLARSYVEDNAVDPLSDEYFEKLHKKPERQEKAIRNSDKGRAQHEKDQIVRLLEGLQGHDWLKLMGVNGVTDSRRREYEPAREHFIKGCEAILEKFRNWKDEEKRRKLEKEQAVAEADADSDMDDSRSNGDPPDFSDTDASAARQLHEENIARSAPRRDRRKTNTVVVYNEPEPEREFKSFFSKPYLRTAALGKHRRSNRSVSAWGHPIPEVPDQDFDLPEEYRDEETLRTHARRKRLNRRLA